MEMETVRIRYTGMRSKKVVELPIPFTAKSEKIGEVICDPIGEFTPEDAEKLLSVAGASGTFEVVDEEEEGKAKEEDAPQVGFKSYTQAMKFKKKNDLRGEIKFSKEKKIYEIIDTLSAHPETSGG